MVPGTYRTYLTTRLRRHVRWTCVTACLALCSFGGDPCAAAQTVTATTGAVNGIVTDSTSGRAWSDGEPLGAVSNDHPDRPYR